MGYSGKILGNSGDMLSHLLCTFSINQLPSDAVDKDPLFPVLNRDSFTCIIHSYALKGEMHSSFQQEWISSVLIQFFSFVHFIPYCLLPMCIHDSSFTWQQNLLLAAKGNIEVPCYTVIVRLLLFSSSE